jgi:hypothetical protein
MTNNPELLAAALESGDAARVGAAVDELHARLLGLNPIPVPPPPEDVPEVLRQAAPGADIDDRLVSYLAVLAQYPFDPALSGAERVGRAIETMLRGGSYAARSLSLRLVTSEDLVAALRYLGERGVRPGREEDQAGWLLSYLLDDAPTRATTARAVRAWPDHPVLARVVGSVPEGMALAERERP